MYEEALHGMYVSHYINIGEMQSLAEVLNFGGRLVKCRLQLKRRLLQLRDPSDRKARVSRIGHSVIDLSWAGCADVVAKDLNLSRSFALCNWPMILAAIETGSRASKSPAL
jgi:hypothetical protein